MKNGQEYYSAVADYYDEDSRYFEKRKDLNEILEFIRSDFRTYAPSPSGLRILEIGCGTGSDLVYFSELSKENTVVGIDISPEMVEISKRNLKDKNLHQTMVEVGTVEDLPGLFSNEAFDLIYVFFGALNTVEDLHKSANILRQMLAADGHMLLTFVNKWYMLGILKPLLKLRFKIALKRLRNIWGGYSMDRFLPSKTYTPSQIRSAFHKETLIQKKGYSIWYPAWYEFGKFKSKKDILKRRWAVDQRLNKTPFWSCGEYTLFLFQKN